MVPNSFTSVSNLQWASDCVGPSVCRGLLLNFERHQVRALIAPSSGLCILILQSEQIIFPCKPVLRKCFVYAAL